MALGRAQRVGAQALGEDATLEVRAPEVQWAAAGTTDWQPVAARQTVRAGDSARTGPGAAARLVYFEGTTVELSASTLVQVERLARSDDGNIITRLVQSAGTTVSRVVRLVDPSASFEVDTPAATAFVRGTQPRVEVAADGSTRVTNIPDGTEGLVVVRGKDQNTTQVTLRPGERTSVQPGPPPALPSIGSSLSLGQGPQAGADLGLEQQQERHRDEQARAEQQVEQARLGLIAAQLEWRGSPSRKTRCSARSPASSRPRRRPRRRPPGRSTPRSPRRADHHDPGALTAITSNAASGARRAEPSCATSGAGSLVHVHGARPRRRSASIRSAAASTPSLAVYTGTGLEQPHAGSVQRRRRARHRPARSQFHGHSGHHLPHPGRSVGRHRQPRGERKRRACRPPPTTIRRGGPGVDHPDAVHRDDR